MSEIQDGCGPGEKAYSFKEWALYYDSAEKTTDRRLALNTSNFSISIALMVGLGVMSSWAAGHTEFRVFLLGGVALISTLGCLFCWLWLGQVQAYKKLNGAKFEVLNHMAPRIRFDVDDDCISADPFRREWEILLRSRGAIRTPFSGVVALASSFQEIIVPFSALLTFGAVTTITMATTITNWQTLIADPLRFPARSPERPVNCPAQTRHVVFDQFKARGA
jgi:hypothetical protein